MRNEKMIDHMKVRGGALPMMDECQSITRIIPEEIRLLMDFQLNDWFLATIILLGQPELSEKVIHPEIGESILDNGTLL